mgnify:CR=1 FL=1
MTRYLAVRIRSKDGKSNDKAVLFAKFGTSSKSSELQARVMAKLADRDSFPQVSQTGLVLASGTFQFAHQSVQEAYAQLAQLVQSPVDFVAARSDLPVDWAREMDPLMAPRDPTEPGCFTVVAVYVLTDKARAIDEDGDKRLRELASFELDQSL